MEYNYVPNFNEISKADQKKESDNLKSVAVKLIDIPRKGNYYKYNQFKHVFLNTLNNYHLNENYNYSQLEKIDKN